MSSLTFPLCPSDGLGAQLQMILYALVFAESKNISFRYTPLKTLDHNYNQDVAYLARIESLIGIKDAFPYAEEQTVCPTVYELLSFYEETHSTDFAESKQLEFARQCFERGNTTPYPNDHYIHVAVHIRRQNKCDRTTQGCVPMEVYVSILEQLRSRYSNLRFHIYSQGTLETFVPSPDVQLHIDESIEDTFRGMVFAHILVVAPSALSFTAGLLCRNMVLYIQHCNPPLPHWNVIQGYQSQRMYHEYMIPLPVIYEPKTRTFYLNQPVLPKPPSPRVVEDNSEAVVSTKSV